MNEFLKFIVDNWVSLSSTIGMIVLFVTMEVEVIKTNK